MTHKYICYKIIVTQFEEVCEKYLYAHVSMICFDSGNLHNVQQFYFTYIAPAAQLGMWSLLSACELTLNMDLTNLSRNIVAACCWLSKYF
jgi:hypothetical protein